MRLPDSAHTCQRWRLHELAPDFRLEDVWALETPGDRDDFPRLVDAMAGFDPARSSTAPVRALFAVRDLAGRALRLDTPSSGVGSRVPSLRERLPADLRDAPAGPSRPGSPFKPLYLTGDEWVLEVANKTVHGLLHLGWVQEEGDAYRGQLAILVKPNGALGEAYMKAISPFRHLVVYPAMTREIPRAWAAS